MRQSLIFAITIAANIVMINYAQANYIGDDINIKDMGYDLDAFTLPATVGDSTGYHDNSSIMYHEAQTGSSTGYVNLSISGTLLGDNLWATSNPGIGIQYRLESGSADFTPRDTETSPDYRVNLTGSGAIQTSYFHVRYRLVRLLDKIPPGKITSLPIVTLNVHNPEGEGTPLISGIVLSKITSNINTTACNIDAPTEIKLPTLYGNELINGAQKITEAPTIMLKNCPGAINGISYNFSAVYGTHNATNGVLNTVTGDGYAKNVYVQIQNADGSAHTVNGSIPLSNYDGSGDYAIPDFKVAYFIDDANTVTAGKVKTAIELKVTYN
ncbi:TPA: fimbrial protein [Salmonella enterica subsp. salamae]